jgi:hypothetical protein
LQTYGRNRTVFTTIALTHLGTVLEPHGHGQVELEAILLVPGFAFETLVFVFVASWSSTTSRMLSGKR